MKESVLEFKLRLLLEDAKIGGWVQEARAHPRRLWRVDFMWPARMMVVECEGGGRGGGRHRSYAGFSEDIEKYNALELLGFTVLRFTGKQIDNGYAIETIREALCEDSATGSKGTTPGATPRTRSIREGRSTSPTPAKRKRAPRDSSDPQA